MDHPQSNVTFSENIDDVIHTAVRDRYAGLASGAGSCCGGSTSDACCDSQRSVYDPALLVDLPVDVTGLSLGCGDPVSIASLRPGETVLDLGSGGGIDCFLAARQVGESGYVIGVDMTPEMLARASASKARLGVTNVEFRQGQIEALPVEDARVDVILSNCVINLAPDKSAVFREAFRVLKPGGRLAISDIVSDGPLPPSALDLDAWSACAAGAIDVSAYLDLLRAAGFEEVRAVDKVSAAEITGIAEQARLVSARITARKPISA